MAAASPRPPAGRPVSASVAALLLVASVLLNLPTARADVVTARRLYSQALELYEARVPQFTRAAQLFEESFREHPTAAALYGVARCERAMRHHADAITALERYLAFVGDGRASPSAAEVRAEIEELRQLVGTVVLDIAPEGAEIEIDGEVRGESPTLVRVLLGPGEHQLRVMAQGYLTRVQRLDVRSGEESHVELALEAVADQATLVLQSTPSEVGVWLDGTPLGETPLARQVTPGTHVLRLWRAGYYTHEETITLGSAQRMARNIGMTEDVVWNHWLFWTILGAAAAGAGVALGYELWPRTDIRGNIPPGIVMSLSW